MAEVADKALLLDTHVWVWLMNGEEPLQSSPMLPQLEETAQDPGLRVSAISIWELGMLEAKGRLNFSLNGEEWVRRALAAPGISLAPLTPEIALASTRLTAPFHGDPADRIIVATARQDGIGLVTRDGRIASYAEEGHLSVLSI